MSTHNGAGSHTRRVPLTARNAPRGPGKMEGFNAVYNQGAAAPGRRALSARPSSSSNGRPRGSANDALLPYGYQTLSPIAQGAFSQVARARHHSSGREVAVKTFNKAKIGKEAHLAQAMKNELDVLKLLQPTQHANIANVVDVFETKQSIYCVLEYCSGGSLQRCLQGLPHAHGLGEPASKALGRQIVHALTHMHGMGLAHRDVKPENVLFIDGSHQQVKLCDFGFAIACGNRRVRTVCGSPQYMAPELSKREPYHGWACDMWAFGAVLFEMLENKPAFRGSSMEQLNIRIMRASHEAFTGATPAGARSLIKGCLQMEVANRLKSKEAIDHVWLGGNGIPERVVPPPQPPQINASYAPPMPPPPPQQEQQQQPFREFSQQYERATAQPALVPVGDFGPAAEHANAPAVPELTVLKAPPVSSSGFLP